MARFPIYKIKNYLIDKKFHPRSIKYLGGGNHFNYKFKSGRRELVLRISNPKAVGAGEMFNVESEFKLLKLVEKYHVSPKPLILELYLGNTLRKASDVGWRRTESRP